MVTNGSALNLWESTGGGIGSEKESNLYTGFSCLSVEWGRGIVNGRLAVDLVRKIIKGKRTLH